MTNKLNNLIDLQQWTKSKHPNAADPRAGNSPIANDLEESTLFLIDTEEEAENEIDDDRLYGMLIW